MGSPASEAALLADMAQLKLEQGDLQGANELFKTALEARKQLEAGSHSDAGGGSDGGGEAEADSWEAWDEDTVPPPAPPPPPAADPPAAADSWESAAAAPPPSRARGGGGGAMRAAVAPEAAAPEDELQYGGGHVLELYGLTPAVKTQHLEAWLERLCRGHAAPPTLKWVDDCHAAVVCSDPAAARQLLAAAAKAGAAEFQLRGYADAGSGTRKLPPSELLPPKPRPKTSAAVARRLIGGALNLKLRDKDAEQELAAARRTQRTEREERQKALDAAWDA